MTSSNQSSLIKLTYVLIAITAIAAIIPLLISTNWYQSPELSVTLLEDDWTSTPGIITAVIQNVGNIPIHNISIYYKTGDLYELQSVRSPESLDKNSEIIDNQLVVHIKKLSTQSYVILKTSGIPLRNEQRSVNVASDEFNVGDIILPSYIQGGISTKIFRDVPVAILALLSTASFVILRIVTVKRSETIRKNHFAYNLKYQVTDSLRFRIVFVLLALTFIVILVYDTSYVSPLPFPTYQPLVPFQFWQPEISENMFLDLYNPIKIHGNEIAVLMVISILGGIYLVPSTVPKKHQWKLESDVRVREIDGSYVKHQEVTFDNPRKIIKKNTEIIILKNEKNRIICLISDYELEKLRMKRNMTFNELFHKQNDHEKRLSRMIIRIKKYVRRKLRMYDRDSLLKEIIERRWNYEIVRADMTVQNSIIKLENSSKRYAVIIEGWDSIIGVLDYSRLV